jgi:hypothetical protein
MRSARRDVGCPAPLDRLPLRAGLHCRQQGRLDSRALRWDCHPGPGGELGDRAADRGPIALVVSRNRLTLRTQVAGVRFAVGQPESSEPSGHRRRPNNILE